MVDRSLHWLCSLLVLGVIAGCASVAPDHAARERLLLERSDEVVAQNRAGRFVLQGLSSHLQERGAQGRFEWLEYRSAQGAARQVLIWLGPLGQSAASLELRRETTGRLSVAAYDDNGRRLSHQDQLRFLSSVLGNGALTMSDAETQQAMMSIMQFFQASVAAQSPRHESQLAIGKAMIHLRIAFDQP